MAENGVEFLILLHIAPDFMWFSIPGFIDAKKQIYWLSFLLGGSAKKANNKSIKRKENSFSLLRVSLPQTNPLSNTEE